MEALKATINSIGGGLAPDLFEAGLAKILDNLADNTTPAKSARSVVLTFTFKADELRSVVDCEIDMKTKLAPVSGRKALLYVSIDDEGHPRATISDPKQAELAFGLASQLSNQVVK